jgi:hypothetical protein
MQIDEETTSSPIQKIYDDKTKEAEDEVKVVDFQNSTKHVFDLQTIVVDGPLDPSMDISAKKSLSIQ